MELRSVEAIAKCLSEAECRYLVVGGIAVNAHGYERFTNDVDLVISLQPENIIRALHALKNIDYHPIVPITPEAFADPENRAKWEREKEMLVLKLWSDKHRRTPVDVFIKEPFNFDEEWKQATHHKLSENAIVPVISYGTLLKMKQEAGRDKDLLDISSLQKLDPYRK